METENKSIFKYHIQEAKKFSPAMKYVAENNNNSFAKKYMHQFGERVVIDGLTDETLKEVVIPKELDGYPVIEIGDGAFKNCKQLESVELPDTVLTLRRHIFEGCERLVKVKLSEGIKDLSTHMFRGCVSLQEIELPQKLRMIGLGSFEGCSSLTQITIPEEVHIIGADAFKNCTSLETVNFPEDLSRVSAGAFSGCTGLEKVKLPMLLDQIDIDTFGGCINLKEVELPEGLAKINISAFRHCDSLKRINIPSNVSNIAEYVLDLITAMKEEHIGKRVHENPFADCHELSEMIVTAGTYGENWAIENGYGGILTVKPLSFTYHVNKAEGTVVITGLNDKAAEQVAVPERIENCPVVAIGEEAFAYCDSLRYVKLPESVKRIGKGAFRMCKNLSVVSLPGSLQNPEMTVFSGCINLRQVLVPSDSDTERWAEANGIVYINN